MFSQAMTSRDDGHAIDRRAPGGKRARQASRTSAAHGGIDKALLTLRDQPSGPALLVAAAPGVVIFGIYGLCEARWRQV